MSKYAKQRAWHERNPEWVRRYQREWQARTRAQLRIEMLAAYGGRCSCCGEDREPFLTLDHMLGDGAAHRRSVGRNRVLRDLQLRGWPQDEYRILCMNCNWATRLGDLCPHELPAS